MMENGSVYPSKNLFRPPSSPDRRTISVKSHPLSPCSRKTKLPGIDFLWAHPKGELSTLSWEKARLRLSASGFSSSTHDFMVQCLVSPLPVDPLKRLFESFASDTRAWFLVRPKAKIQGGAEIRKNKQMHWKKKCVLLVMVKLNLWGSLGRSSDKEKVN